MARLNLSVLGEFQVMLDDIPISSIKWDKVHALLAYLAVEADRSHRRETLFGLLWPESPEGAARHNLSQALFNLRLALDDHTARPPYLLISRNTIQFNRESDYSLDLERFNANFSAWEKDREGENPSDRFSLFEEMIRLYRGEFLRQFFLIDSAEFDEWILVQREALHQRVMSVLTTLTNGYEQQGDFQAARRYANRQLELDPWREEAHFQMMRLLALDDQRSAALAQYENCRKVLAEELGVEPSPKTRALYEHIRSGEFKPKDEQPALVSSPLIHNLPIPLTPLIGREQELADLARLIADPECRCITLVGTGGIGKTRLALQVANQPGYEFSQGIAFIPLGSVASVDAVVQAISGGIGFAFYGPADPKIQLLNYLREKQMLLVVDSVDHLLVVDPQQDTITVLLIEILQQCTQIKLLVTSREGLNLQGEWIFEVQGLAFPEQEQTERLEEYSAAALFLQRARRARPGFEMNAEDKKGVVRLCRLVEGLPLAIELAAAWVRVLSPAEIANEVETNLDFLNTQMRDLPERHRSMRAVFDHSWHMLSTTEKKVLSRLSVFHGGFQRQAAEQVAGASLQDLSSLVIRSLLRRSASGRYDLHDLLRKYALAKLMESPDELENTKNIHSNYYLEFFGDREGGLRNNRQLTVMAEIKAEIENIRVAWRHAVVHGHVARLRKPVRGFWFFDICAWFQEAYSLFHWTLEESESKNDMGEKGDAETIITREHIRADLAYICIKLGKIAEAGKLLNQSLPVIRSYGPCIELLNALDHMGVLERLSGNCLLSQELFLEMLDVATKLGSRWHIAIAHGNIGLAKNVLGDYQEAYNWLYTSNTILREEGDRRILGVALQFFGEVLRNLGEYAEAQDCLNESLEISKIFDDRWLRGVSLNQLGLVFKAKGEYEEAAHLFRESLVQLREIDGHWGMLQALNNLGSLYLSQGINAEARSAYCELLSIAGDEQILPEALEALIGMAHILKEEGDLEEALVLVTLAIDHPLLRFESKALAERISTELISLLTPQQVEASHVWKNGITLPEVISEVILTGRIHIWLDSSNS